MRSSLMAGWGSRAGILDRHAADVDHRGMAARVLVQVVGGFTAACAGIVALAAMMAASAPTRLRPSTREPGWMGLAFKTQGLGRDMAEKQHDLQTWISVIS